MFSEFVVKRLTKIVSDVVEEMAMGHEMNMDQNFLPADPPPVPDVYQPKTDLATEYFNTFSQICDNYRSDSDINLRQTSDTLRLSSEILDGAREEFISTDFLAKNKEYQAEYAERIFMNGKDEQIFQFGQPDASALLRHRARRRYNEEHGLPTVTSQESGVSRLELPQILRTKYYIFLLQLYIDV